ncbi:MAG: DUF2442 domain-containing protein [Bacteriovorax sp.]|nr:DUF2442 domain-containing protein [Bacteriovorax sp.]
MNNQKIIDVKTFPGKTLWLKFQDGFEGTFCFTDFFELNKDLSKKLQDDSYFSQVTINHDFGCIEWPNGYDPSPEVLYAIVRNQKIIISNKVVFDPSLGKNAWL